MSSKTGRLTPTVSQATKLDSHSGSLADPGRVGALLALQRMIGNQGVQQMLRSAPESAGIEFDHDVIRDRDDSLIDEGYGLVKVSPRDRSSEEVAERAGLSRSDGEYLAAINGRRGEELKAGDLLIVPPVIDPEESAKVRKVAYARQAAAKDEREWQAHLAESARRYAEQQREMAKFMAEMGEPPSEQMLIDLAMRGITNKDVQAALLNPDFGKQVQVTKSLIYQGVPFQVTGMHTIGSQPELDADWSADTEYVDMTVHESASDIANRTGQSHYYTWKQWQQRNPSADPAQQLAGFLAYRQSADAETLHAWKRYDGAAHIGNFIAEKTLEAIALPFAAENPVGFALGYYGGQHVENIVTRLTGNDFIGKLSGFIAGGLLAGTVTEPTVASELAGQRAGRFGAFDPASELGGELPQVGEISVAPNKPVTSGGSRLVGPDADGTASGEITVAPRAPVRGGSQRTITSDEGSTASGEVEMEYAGEPQTVVPKVFVTRTFLSQRQAVHAALEDSIASSKAENLEYGGRIYRTRSGRYGYTAPQRGTRGSIRLDEIEIPEGAQAVGDYHTHGDYSVKGPDGTLIRSATPQHSDDAFSHGDIGEAYKNYHRAGAPSEYASYLATPGGRVIRFRPGDKGTNVDLVRAGDVPEHVPLVNWSKQ